MAIVSVDTIALPASAYRKKPTGKRVARTINAHPTTAIMDCAAQQDSAVRPKAIAKMETYAPHMHATISNAHRSSQQDSNATLAPASQTYTRRPKRVTPRDNA
jgi:hypothetical protein